MTRRANRGRRRRAAFVAAAAAVTFAAGLSTAGPVAEADVPSQPNFIVVMTDDQYPRSVSAMPYLSSRSEWIDFTRAFVNQPLCCPARAAFLTGRYAHHNKVRSNLEATRLDESATLPVWLREAGYETAFFGKYMNHYPTQYPWRMPADSIPFGWDHWVGFSGRQSYYDYFLNDNGSVSFEPESASGYSTDLFTDRLVDYLDSTSGPFFAWISLFAPHSPITPAPRHLSTEIGEPNLPPSFDERNVRDKPRWVRNLRRPDPDRIREARSAHNRSLLAVDEAVERIVAKLTEIGELEDTVLIFTTDHGFSYGEHRYRGKNCAYDECARVPLLMRVPGVAGGTSKTLVGNVDLAPTMIELAGSAPAQAVDGHSLVPVLNGEASRVRNGLLVERARGAAGRRFWSIRTLTAKLTVYPKTGEVELYDLKRDRFERRNVAGRHRYRAKQRTLRDRLRELKRARPR